MMEAGSHDCQHQPQNKTPTPPIDHQKYCEAEPGDTLTNDNSLMRPEPSNKNKNEKNKNPVELWLVPQEEAIGAIPAITKKKKRREKPWRTFKVQIQEWTRVRESQLTQIKLTEATTIRIN